mmetsp:Transcript_13785/g.24935  ORF Transcript_13785/g.24935 Transcript_13785/m.24935 type:complete len:87 (-) Transcript_13785:306-566(-)
MGNNLTQSNISPRAILLSSQSTHSALSGSMVCKGGRRAIPLVCITKCSATSTTNAANTAANNDIQNNGSSSPTNTVKTVTSMTASE